MPKEEIDLRPFTRLHTFVMLRDLIRKWWRLELFLADARGEVIAEEELAERRGCPVPRDNDFCRLSLHAKVGERRCSESLRVTIDKLMGGGRLHRQISHECHLGFDIVACAIWLDGEMAGCVAVSGAVHDPLSGFAETQLLRKVREVSPGAGSGTDLERALRRVPILARVEVEQLGDLLLLCADEIQAHHEAARGRRQPPSGDPFFLGSSPPMQETLRSLDRAAQSGAPVLIEGERGTGKGLLCRLLHERGAESSGAARPFILQPCASMRAQSLELELFGDESSPGGRWHRATGGTLVLEDVEELPPPLQERLLVAIRRDRAGAPPRILTTTEQSLEELAGSGRVLEPLLDLISSHRIRVPPLRQRTEDIPVLCQDFLRRHGRPTCRPDRAAMKALLAYPWPGNVRELLGEVARMVALSSGEERELPVDLLSPRIAGAGGISA